VSLSKINIAFGLKALYIVVLLQTLSNSLSKFLSNAKLYSTMRDVRGRKREFAY